MKKFYQENIPLNDENLVKDKLETLLNVEIKSTSDLVQWLQDKSVVLEEIEETLTGHYIALQCDNTDQDIKKAYQHDSEVIQPLIKKYTAKYDEKFYNSEFRHALDTSYYEQYILSKENAINLFREDNIQLEVEEEKLSTRYFEITGSLTVNWNGEEKTLSQMAVFLKDSDRTVREKAWKLVHESLLSKNNELGDIMSDLIKIREEKAKNADVANYRDFMFKKYERFSYTAEDCHELAAAIKEHVVPLKEALEKKHQAEINVSNYRPWDVQAVPEGKLPLKPFKNVEELISGTETMLNKIDPKFGNLISEMNKRDMLDLENRKGKSPGGFCAPLPVSNLSFIFMNATGNQSDLTTLVHEMGHCIHNMYKEQLPLSEYKDTPMESAELASMTMELFSMHLWDQFYDNEEDLKRAKREQLEGIIKFLPHGVVIDQFQHWMYENPSHSKEERNEKFYQLAKQFFASNTDFSGYEDALANRWVMTLHIFEVPFYYIEYVIAQLGAVQMYKQFKENPEKAVENYKKALSLGKSKSLPEVYETAGISFDFSAKMVKELMEFISEELDALK
ncbi:oligoendopeptidase F [Lottiidibacillus patelloidae]|uniref:Oligoendopeptidase F n=1 Tax=Lottiidibacillus patelloidae TaxID=2670334 RepID=A0A263BUN4_9BACI|nr:M3 family oligoendopeptidase [Lottiidibacillus patelloidae]OZM57453.1 oligoendopeptidase F [Lottiidibacillus patelloidae]